MPSSPPKDSKTHRPILRPPPLYSTVLEVDERVTLVRYTSDPLFRVEEHVIQFDDGSRPGIKRGYRGQGWDGVGDAEGPSEIVRVLSGEAVREGDDVSIGRNTAASPSSSSTRPPSQTTSDLLASSASWHVSESATLLAMIKMVPRGVSSSRSVPHAYSESVSRWDGFLQGFDDKLRDGALSL